MAFIQANKATKWRGDDYNLSFIHQNADATNHNANEAEELLNALQDRIAVNTLRDQVNAGWSVLNMIDGISDEYNDSTGVGPETTANLTNGSYGGEPAENDPAYSFGTYLGTNNLSNTTGNKVSRSGNVSNIRIRTQNAADYIIKKGTLVSGNNYTFTDITTVTVTSTDEETIAIPTTAFDVDDVIAYYKSGGGVNTYGVYNGGVGARSVYVSGNVTGSGTIVEYNVDENYGIGAIFDGADFNYTLQSIDFTADDQPDFGRLVILHEAIDAVTLNTDVKAYISRDGGTTFEEATLVEADDFNSTVKILTTGDIDVSGQSAGTDMEYKIETFNTKEQRIHGTWMQWR